VDVFVHERHAKRGSCRDLPVGGHDEETRFEMDPTFTNARRGGLAIEQSADSSVGRPARFHEYFSRGWHRELARKSLSLTAYMEFLLKTSNTEWHLRSSRRAKPERRERSFHPLAARWTRSLRNTDRRCVIGDWLTGYLPRGRGAAL